MKNRACALALFLSFLLVLTACSDRGQGDTPPSSTPTPSTDNTYTWYDWSGILYGSNAPGNYQWDVNSQYVVLQDENVLTYIGRDNNLIKRVELDPLLLPERYLLSWNESRILSISNSWDYEEQGGFGMIYDFDGELFLSGVSLWDMEGTLLKQYHLETEEGGDYRLLIGEEGGPDWSYNLSDGNSVYWLDENIAALNCHSRVILYDFSTDTARVVDDLRHIVEPHGKFGVYYGVNASYAFTRGDTFYYMAHRSEESSNSYGTIWAVGKNDTAARELFGGQEFSMLEMDGPVMALARWDNNLEGAFVYWASTEDEILRDIDEMPLLHIPIAISNGLITYNSGVNIHSREASIVVYDTNTGVLTQRGVPNVAGIRDIHSAFYNDEGQLVTFFSGAVTDEEEPCAWLYNCETGALRDIAPSNWDTSIKASPDGERFLFCPDKRESVPQAQVREFFPEPR